MPSSVKSLLGNWSCPRLHRSFVLSTIAVLLLPAAASAQVTYTGTAASQNFGSQPIGSASAAKTLSFSVAAGTTVGSIGVVTQGAPNLDFTNATGSTCTAKDYSSATTCTVNVTFTPRAPGLRMGAVVFFSEAGNTGTVLGSVPIYGTGTGPQIAFETSVKFSTFGQTFIASSTGTAISPTVNGLGLGYPTGVAVDSAGDLFIADPNNDRVVEVPAGGGAATAIDPTVNGKALDGPGNVAVDGAGDLFIADSGNERVVEMPAGGGTPIAIAPTVNGLGLNGPGALAVDEAGDLFIADTGNSRVVEVPAGGGEAIAITPTASGSCGITALGVDGAGDVFVGCPDALVEVPAGGGAQIAFVPSSDYYEAAIYGLAVDGLGDVFATSFFPATVFEFISGNFYDQISFAQPEANGISVSLGPMAVDGAGDLLFADYFSRVVEVQRSQPPAVNFPTVTAVGATDTTDGTQTVLAVNIGNETLTLTAVSFPADFSAASGGCGAGSLNPGSACGVPIQFTPEHIGALSEDVTLTDNALNVAGPQQSIAVSGTARAADLFSVTTKATVAAGTSFTITITALSTSNHTVTTYNGTVTFTSSDPLFVNPGPITLSGGVGQATVTLKTTGTQTITATDTVTPALTGSGSFNVGPGLATLTSPTPGTTLGISNIPFAWSPGYGVSRYCLSMGISGPGSTDMFDSGVTTATSIVVPTLPALGVTLYVRLYTVTQSSAGWEHQDYTYTLATPLAATINSPTPGTTLGISNIPFAWSPGYGVSRYGLSMGISGPGSTDMFDSGVTTATSIVVPTLPALGVTLYVRLYTVTQSSAGWEHQDYTYTMATPQLATLNSPTPGNTVGTSNIPFAWLPGYGVSQYGLCLGINGPGSSDMYASGTTKSTSVVVPTLPKLGVTLYARLFTFNPAIGNWQHIDYTYKMTPP